MFYIFYYPFSRSDYLAFFIDIIFTRPSIISEVVSQFTIVQGKILTKYA